MASLQSSGISDVDMEWLKRAVSCSVMKVASVFRIAGCNESGPGPLVGSSDSRTLFTLVGVITNDSIDWVLLFMAGVGVP